MTAETHVLIKRINTALEEAGVGVRGRYRKIQDILEYAGAKNINNRIISNWVAEDAKNRYNPAGYDPSMQPIAATFDTMTKVKSLVSDFEANKPVSIQPEEVQDIRASLEAVLKKANHPLDDAYLADEFDVSPRRIRAEMEGLIDEGYPITQPEEGTYFWPKKAVPAQGLEVDIEESGEWRKFALISDTHGGSLHEQLQALHEFYDICERENVTQVFHAGDITHGLKVYPGQYMDLKPYWSYETQVGYVSRSYPYRKGITTHFICGNHDEDAVKRQSADPGRRLEKMRPHGDLKYVGMYNGMANYAGLRIMLNHGAGGMAYARSYKLQKMLERLPRWDTSRLPHILALGHYHISMFLPKYQSVDAYLPGAFEGRNNLLKRLGIYPAPSAWILECRIVNDQIVDSKHRIIHFENEDHGDDKPTVSLNAYGGTYTDDWDWD